MALTGRATHPPTGSPPGAHRIETTTLVNLRALLDIELQTGNINLDQAAQKIEALGFSEKRARRQARRFALTPGYQLCYAMGMYEILSLREQYAPKLGLKSFDETLLNGGQLPFHLVGRRLETSGQIG